ncbi:permease for cytosine/purines, uracil, thiamine, allantoin-domain-containing protein [Ilyonectria destructans]|nr:permease for cytosine/purines, uracil, thiamine, allantoin-domain-containing protein [Ilyonectria destructans]
MLDDYSAKARATAFFYSLGYVISQLTENTLGNGFAAGMDLAGLFPNWMNIRRGGIICALLSWAVQPWLFYNTASVFMGPLTGIMIADYFIIRQQRIQLSQLYTGSPDGSYWYAHGFNSSAIIAWVVGFAPAMPGIIAAANPSVVVSDGIYKYYLGIICSYERFLTATTLYTALRMIFKVGGAGLQDDTDVYGTISEDVALKKGMSPFLLDEVRQSKLENEGLGTV